MSLELIRETSMDSFNACRSVATYPDEPRDDEPVCVVQSKVGELRLSEAEARWLVEQLQLQLDERRWDRSRWLADLATWPRGFRVRLEPLVRRMDEHGSILGPSGFRDEDLGFNVARIRRDVDLGGALCSFDAAGFLAREARGSRTHLRHYQTRLLLMLWMSGRRRVDRRSLSLRAPRPGSTEAASVKRCEAGCARIRATLERGVVETGARKGQPYTAAHRARVEAQLVDAERQLSDARRDLERASSVWAQANPLKYALECYPRAWREVHRAQAASDQQRCAG